MTDMPLSRRCFVKMAGAGIVSLALPKTASVASGRKPNFVFILVDDMGLAANYPREVGQLDALIEQHLRETGALAPIPNPKYDPNAKPEKQNPAGNRKKPREQR